MPTILELAGIDVPEYVQGSSLLPLLRSETTGLHDFVVTSWPLHAQGIRLRVVDDRERATATVLPTTTFDGRWTLISSTRGEPIELYDLTADPRQESNISASHPEVVRSLHDRLLAYLEDLGTEERYLAPRRELLR
jgi:iduronate 2-sulfatase